MSLHLEDFIGRWTLHRVIDDSHGGTQGHFEGEARFTREKNGLLYEEVGLLRLGNQPGLTATRRYFWRPDGSGVSVAFDDGRPFHSFDFEGQTEAAHWCDPDQYRVLYSFRDWPSWSARWSVKGPRKDYVMTSRYVSAAA